MSERRGRQSGSLQRLLPVPLLPPLLLRQRVAGRAPRALPALPPPPPHTAVPSHAPFSPPRAGPHTLSSRPLVFPLHMVLRVKVPPDSRSEAYLSFDGKSRQVCARARGPPPPPPAALPLLVVALRSLQPESAGAPPHPPPNPPALASTLPNAPTAPLQRLNPGDSVLIQTSQWPVPMVCNLDSSHDWFLR